MSVDILLGIVENCAWSSHNATDWSTDENCEGPNLPTQRGCILKMKEKKCFFFFFFPLFVCSIILSFWLGTKRQFLRCSQMMSRNSIRLIKGQNWIELIYRVNSESLMMKKKVWTSLLLKHKLLVTRRGALFTFQWESVDSVKRFLLRRSCCFDDKYFSICSRHYSAIPPLHRNYINWSYFSNSSHITESHREGYCDAFGKRQTSLKVHIFCSDFPNVWELFVQEGGGPYDVLIHSSCLTSPTLSAILRSTEHGEKKCAILYTKSLTCEGCWLFLMCHYFVKCFTEHQPPK